MVGPEPANKCDLKLLQGNGSCKRCGFEGDNAAGLTQHNCSEVNNECPSDSDKSVKLDQYSEDESIDSDVDSNVSNEEIQVEKKKKKHGDHSKFYLYYSSDRDNLFLTFNFKLYQIYCEHNKI